MSKHSNTPLRASGLLFFVLIAGSVRPDDWSVQRSQRSWVGGRTRRVVHRSHEAGVPVSASRCLLYAHRMMGHLQRSLLLLFQVRELTFGDAPRSTHIAGE